MIGEKKAVDRIVDAAICLVLLLLALSCLFPFVHVLAQSFSSKGAISANKVGLWPVGFNLDNYRYLMRDKGFFGSFRISVARVILGVLANVLMSIVTAYPLSLDNLHMPGRTVFKVFMLVGMLFSGGLIPMFLTLRIYGLLNKFAVLILPGVLSIFNTIVIINFFRGIPQELREAAIMDGASHLVVLLHIYLPVSVPALATVTLFFAVGHWNAWFDGIIYLNRTEKWPLQSYLYPKVALQALPYDPLAPLVDYVDMTPQGLVAAFIFFASVPIMLVYPFLQRYFVTGLTLGSVKG